MIAATCTAKQPIGAYGELLGYRVCDLPAVAKYRFACTHGHTCDRPVCPAHVPTPGSTGCYQCLREGHECAMTAEQLQIVPS